MSKKIIFCVLAVLCWWGIILPAFVGAEDKPGRPVTIGVLLFSKNNLRALDAFKAGLQELGYVEGRDVILMFNGVVEKSGELDAAVSWLVSRKPDLVYAAPTLAAHAAQKQCRGLNIPVLFGPANNALKSGLVKDLRQPGENITGVMLGESEGKRMQWTVAIAPHIKNIFIPYNPQDKSALVSLQSAKECASRLDLGVVTKEVRTHQEIDALLASLPEGIDSFYLPRDALVMSRIKDFAELAKKKKLILSTGTRISYVEQGALLSYGFDDVELGRQVARQAEKIMKGIPPGDLPVETADDYLAINLVTAEAIGLEVGRSALSLAHKVVRKEN